MSQADPSLTRLLITLCGRVQGVGFRPFIYRLAHAHKLVGNISNTTSGVRIDVQGPKDAVAKFQQDVIHQKPERATITDIAINPASPCHHFSTFEIRISESVSDKALSLLPDTAMCPECLQELFDPKNRRYQYPFLHCTSCGPRFSLFLRMPFDRGNTTMTEFCMCEDCEEEYANPKNRRFYSQTNCCSRCGPHIQLVDEKGNLIAPEEDSLDLAAQYLNQGKIVAMKNTGGYLLLADASNELAVQRLRLRKRRPGKPFAMLIRDLEAVEAISHLGPMEKSLLISPAAPIVLIKKKSQNTGIAFSVAHQSPYYGIMLPHNALQHLLLRRFARPLVATSGNMSGQPLCITEQEAFKSLSPIADLFLIHNRKIHNRLDDSIVHVIADQPVVMRRARGYIPHAIPISNKTTQNLFAAGSQMKNSFAFLQQGQIYMSQHIGDLDSVDNCNVYDTEISRWEELLGFQQSESVRDLHPNYYNSLYLQKRSAPSTKVQHHKAHVWAAMTDNQLSPPFFAVAWDGTGWGDDATIWGGESFLFGEDGMRRIASLYPFPLPGGEKGVKEPRRSMLGLLFAMSGSQIPSHHNAWPKEAFTKEELAILLVALNKKINTPICSSMGRLFDAISALLGICLVSDFEGQAALLLEKEAHLATGKKMSYEMPPLEDKEMILLDWRPMIEQMFEDKKKGIQPAEIAMAFHETLAQAIVKLAKIADKETVLLTGGVMQNKLLVERAVSLLKLDGFKPYTHRDIPPNDGGIAVGQVIGKLSLPLFP